MRLNKCFSHKLATALSTALVTLVFTSLSFAEKAATIVEPQIYFPASEHKLFDGPDAYFTGQVKVEMLFPSNETADYSGAYVTFQPGARTAWHLHPAGQHMVITSGTGLTGTRDGHIVKIKKGDALWCPPNIDHWHGATPDAPMTHLVITGSKDGKNVIWKEKVTDKEYHGDDRPGKGK